VCVVAKRSAATEDEEEAEDEARRRSAMAPSSLLSLPTPLAGAFVADSRACSGRVAEDKRSVRFERPLGLRSWSKSVVCTFRCVLVAWIAQFWMQVWMSRLCRITECEIFVNFRLKDNSIVCKRRSVTKIGIQITRLSEKASSV